ncbi:malonyl-[acyl-carrier protein] O-methyltransferase BioC [Marinomonas agarivorans]|nr:malonyl-[acyl-carrier protein] O-methyltransferase BioC [Marinomonas agarivorans]
MATDYTDKKSKRANCYKREVARSFDRAAKTYNDFALFQQQVLSKLITLCPIRFYSSVLDLGCGTGNATSLLQPKTEQLISLDLSLSMLKIVARKDSNQLVVCADAESLPFKHDIFDLIFSNLAIQWSQQPKALAREVNRTLTKKGYFLASSLSQGSMPEIEQAWLDLDAAPHVNKYDTITRILEPFLIEGFDLHSHFVEPVTMWFDTPEQAVHSLKKIGASVLMDASQKRPVTPGLWRQFLSKYEEMRTPQGIPLTYNVAYFLLQKP